MKVLFLYSQGGQIVTGGQKYEDMLFNVLKDNPRLTVERVWLNNITGKLSKYTSPLRNLALARKLRGYDLVFFNSVSGLNFIPLALLLRFAMRRKTAVIHHHFLYREKSGIRRLWYKMLEIGFLRAASTIVVPSPYINHLCHDMFPGREIRYWQIPFDPSPVPLPLTPEPGNLLYTGTIERRKGLEYLLRAMTILKNRGIECRLTAVGKTVEPAYRAMLDDMIAADKLDVRFTGFIPLEEKERIMASADIFVFPSQMEGYGMVLCESMVNATPVVCFDNSAMPYTVSDGENGLLVPDRDTEKFADAIERITTDRGLRRKLSEGASATATTFMTPARYREKANRETEEMLGMH